MARNSPVPRPRRRARSGRAHAAAAIGGATPGASDPGTTAPPLDDARIVYGWLARLTTDPAEAERLLVEILGLARSRTPACLRGAPQRTHLQFLTVQSVLRLRGVL